MTVGISMAGESNPRLKILMVHNTYQQRGGEDTVVGAEIAMLQAHGHEVEVYQRDNHDIATQGRLDVAGQALWSRRTENDVARLIARFRPDVLHAHNTFPLVSPSLYWTASACSVPIVQTLHNFRLLCPQGMLLREGKVCEDCVGKAPWRSVVRGCYRNSAVQSAVLSTSLQFHRTLGSYRHKVTRYIALNEFGRRKFIDGGLPAERISVKPNFVDFPAPTEQLRHGGLFVGRLSEEKGIATLLAATSLLPLNIKPEVIGDGPLAASLNSKVRLRCLGWQSRQQIINKMQQASYLLMPSICYEAFGLVAIEAFACGLPVIASRLGSMAELVQEGVTGLLFEPGSAADLAAKILWAERHPEQMRLMGQRARLEYERRYTPEKNLSMLLDIYDQAMREHQGVVVEQLA